MSSVGDGQFLANQPAESASGTNVKSKITYSRGVLLSLSESDVCQKFPSDFDELILRRDEYGSPPTTGDSGSYSSEKYGKRGFRSFWESDKNSQSDWRTDSGRHHAAHSHRGWQAPIRSTEPYHPPRLYQPVPHRRSSTSDSLNDETFGAPEFNTEDRGKEERKRRASFESLRKEQQKALQERPNIGKPIDDFDITTLMEDSISTTDLNNQNDPNKKKALLSLHTDYQETSVPVQIPRARPLVPPGFSSATLEKKYMSAEPLRMADNHTQIPRAVHSSKFMHLFSEGGEESTETLLSGRSSDLPPPVFREEKGGSAARSQQSLPNSLATVSQRANEKKKSTYLSAASASPEGFCSEAEVSGTPDVFDCQYLEKSILSEFSAGGPKAPEQAEVGEIPYAKNKPHKNDVDNLASQPLLSLIQKGKDIAMPPNKGAKHSDPSENCRANVLSGLHNNSETGAEIGQKVCGARQTSLLETVFGSDLMKALQSDGGPVSAQGAGSARLDPVEPHESGIPMGNNKFIPSSDHDWFSTSNFFQAYLAMKDPRVLEAVQKDAEAAFRGFLEDETYVIGQPEEIRLPEDDILDATSAQGAGSARLDPVEPHESGIPMGDKKFMPFSDLDLFAVRNLQVYVSEEDRCFLEALLKDEEAEFPGFLVDETSGIGQPEEIRLPENDSLDATGDIFIIHGKSGRNSNKDGVPSYRSQFDVGGPQRTLDSLFKDSIRVMEQAVPSFPVAYERREPNNSFLNVQNPPFSPQLQPRGLNQMGPIYNSQDSHTILNNPHMNQRDSMLHLGTPPNHQYPRSMLHSFHHPNVAFDRSALHPLIQQMDPHGSLPLNHQLQGTADGPCFTRPNQQFSGLMEDLNSVPGFPFDHQQPSFGGMLPPATEVGMANNHPEALQRLLGMEHRSEVEPGNPFPAAAPGHGQGLHGHDLHSNFQYR